MLKDRPLNMYGSETAVVQNGDIFVIDQSKQKQIWRNRYSTKHKKV